MKWRLTQVRYDKKKKITGAYKTSNDADDLLDEYDIAGDK